MKRRWDYRFATSLAINLIVISLFCVPVPAHATTQHADTRTDFLPSTFIDCATQTQIPESECNALLALYNTTRGADWSNHTGWLQTNTPCSWFGIVCGDGSHVTELDLAYNNLVGRIPQELGDLTKLQVLYLGLPLAISIDPEVRSPAIRNAKPDGQDYTGSISNQLSGTIPPELGGLTSLRLLALSGNQLSGSIPAELGNLSHLQMLALDGNQLSDSIPPELGNLLNLQELYLRFNQLTGVIPPELGRLTNLHILALSNNQLTGSIPAELSSLAGLYYLVLNNNQLSGAIPPELGGLAGLQLLILSDNQLSGNIPHEMGSLTGLSWMYLHHNHITGQFPASISNLVSLEAFTFDCWLTSTDSTVIDFIDSLNPGWQNSICPIVTSITRGDPNPPSSSTVHFIVTFSESVTEVNADDFVLAASGVTGAEIMGVSGSATVYTVSVNRGSGNGTIQLEIPDTATIYNLIGNPLADLPFTKSEAYRIMLMDCAAQTQIPTPECEALVALFYSTGGANWSQNTGWLENDTPCSWFGVTCGNGTNVTEVRLPRNHLIGSIPAQLGNLSNVIYLDLDRNQLTGSIPPELGDLTKLQTLSLSGNQFSGSIPSQLGNLSNLNVLWLQVNRLTGPIPVELANLVNIKDLRLYLNHLSGPIPAQLGSLPNLAVLDLEGNQLTGSIPPELGNLTNLDTLLLFGNQLTGPIPGELGNLSNLRILVLQTNQLTGSIPLELADLTNLQDLRLSENQLTGSIPSALGTLTNLRVLDLHDNQLTGSITPELGNLGNLDSLYLSRNQLSGSIPPQLGNLSNLTILALGDNQLTGPIPPEFGNLSNMWILTMQNNQLTGSIPDGIGNMTRLDSLGLNGNQFRGELPPGIAHLENLVYFEFDCWLTSTDPVMIAFLENRRPGWQTKVCPIVSSINRANPNPSNSSYVNFIVTFSEKVTGVNLADFALSTTGITGAAITKIEGSNKIYTVTVKTGAGDGTIRLDVMDNDSIRDVSNNTLGGAGNGNGDFTTGEEYTIVKSVTVPSEPILSLPAAGSLVTSLQPSFDWKDSVPTAHHYQIQISTSNTFATLAINEINIPVSTFTPTAELTPGKTYYWRVKAFNESGVGSTWSASRNFRTPLTSPILLTPVDAQSLWTDRPTFTWASVPGVSHYVLEVSASSRFSTLLLNATVSGTEYNVSKDLPQNKTLYWRVRGKSTAVTGPWSMKWSFKTGNPPSVPVLVVPANGALVKDYTPLLNWNNSTVPAGTILKHYEIQMDEQKDFSSPVINTTTTPGDIADSDFTPLSDLASNTKYYWRVRAVNTVNAIDHTSGWSTVWSFRTIIPAPQSLVMTPDPENPLQPSFSWDAATGVISGYTIQISTTSNFSTLLVNSTTPDPWYDMLKNLPAHKTIYWRVRVNGSNGPSAWTKTQFTTP